jgi:hypothetical protein
MTGHRLALLHGSSSQHWEASLELFNGQHEGSFDDCSMDCHSAGCDQNIDAISLPNKNLVAGPTPSKDYIAIPSICAGANSTASS